MPTIEEDIQLLIQIVQKDSDIRERRKLIESVPTRIKAIDRELKRMDEEYAETNKTLDKLERERSQINRDIDAQKHSIEAKRNEQRSVKTNKEYQALMIEIQYLASQIDKEETRLIAIDDENETRRREIKRITDRIASEKSTLENEKKSLEGALREAQDALKIIEDEKLRIMPHISERIRALYARILKAKGDSGVANVVADICQGCYSRVPPQKALEIRRNDDIFTCEVCGRILVYYEKQ